MDNKSKAAIGRMLGWHFFLIGGLVGVGNIFIKIRVFSVYSESYIMRTEQFEETP